MERAMLKVLLACAFAALLGVAAVGCGGSDESDGGGSGERAVVTVWDQPPPNRTETQAQIDEAFMKEHPEIEIKREYYPYDQIEGLAKNAFRTESGPDVVYIDVSPARNLFRAGLTADLTPYAERHGWDERFTEAGLEWTRDDDALFGLGGETEFFGMIYNETLLDELGLTAPRTIDEAVDFCRAARAQGYVPIAAAGGDGGWAYMFYTAFSVMNAIGPEAQRALVSGGEGSWTTPEIERSMNGFFKDMKDAGCFPPNLNGIGYDHVLDLLTTGKALIGVPLPQAASGELVKAREYEWSFAPWPAPAGGAGSFYSNGMGSAYVVGANSGDKEAAATYLDYLFSPEVTAKIVEEEGQVPPVRLDVGSLDVSPLFKEALEILNHPEEMGVEASIICPTEFFEVTSSQGQAAFDGKVPVATLLQDMQRACEQQ